MSLAEQNHKRVKNARHDTGWLVGILELGWIYTSWRRAWSHCAAVDRRCATQSDGAAALQRLQRRHDGALRAAVQRAGRLVQQQDACGACASAFSSNCDLRVRVSSTLGRCWDSLVAPCSSCHTQRLPSAFSSSSSDLVRACSKPRCGCDYARRRIRHAAHASHALCFPILPLTHPVNAQGCTIAPPKG